MTETWLDDHKEAELHIPGYSIYHENSIRKRKKGARNVGGVALYIRDDHAITCEVVFRYSDNVIQALGVHIKTLNLLIYVIYRQPDDTIRNNRSTSVQFSKLLKNLKEQFKSHNSPEPDVILLGDLNLPHADWLNGECVSGASSDEQKMVRNLYNLMLEHFLIQQIDCPTHEDGNTIDLVFTNNSDLVHSFSALPTSRSDHYLIEILAAYKPHSHSGADPDCNDTPNHPNDTGFNDLNFFSEDVNWHSLNKELSEHNWEREFYGLNSESMLDRFLSVCLSIAKDCVPLRKKAMSKTKQNHIPKDRRKLMRTRTRIKQQMLRATADSKIQSLTRRLIDIEKKLQKSHYQQTEFEESKAVENIGRNSKFFFAYAKKFSKIKIGVGPLINTAKSVVTSAKKMAEILSAQYCSVFSKPKYSELIPNELFPNESRTGSTIGDIYFSDTDLSSAMDELSINSAAGPDGFPAILLKTCRNSLAPPLANIWRKSMNEGSVPKLCKTANVIPIHKGKSRALPQNYRPVALTSQLIKVFEKVVRKHIVFFMEEHNLFNPSQHGFRSGRSCLSQLLCHLDRVTKLLEEGKSVDCVYLDFSKAFDKVDIGITLHKLKLMGIRGKLGRWLLSFLTNRVQTILVNGSKSDPQKVLSGVPQGSVLGPLLFLILIGDIDQTIVSSFLSSFADDTRIGKEISTIEDTQLLQSDLNKVYEWALNNNMEFNSDKFEVIRYKGKKSHTLDDTSYTSNIGNVIEEKSQLKDLGVILSNDATFKQHISQKVTSLKAKIGWVMRTFHTRDKQPMLTLWKQLIIFDHDYCSQAWSPSKTGEIQELELLQKAFVRKIKGMQGLSYWEQLRELNLYSLERRRERYMAIYTWKILEGHVPNIETTPIESQYHIRRGRCCLIPKVSNTAPVSIQNIRLQSLSVRGPRIFNILPSHIRAITGSNVDAFKKSLDEFLSTIPDQPLVPGYTQFRRCDTNSLLDWCVSSHLRQMEGQDRMNNIQVVDVAVADDSQDS